MKKVGDYENIKNKLTEHGKIYGDKYEKIDICGQEAYFGYLSEVREKVIYPNSDGVSGELVYIFGTYYHQIEALNQVNTQFFPNFKRSNKDEIRRKIKDDAIRLARLYCEKYNK